MHMKGKKPIFNYKDTFSLDNTLSPIICEGLKKFKEVLSERDSEGKCYGTPWSCYEAVGAKPDYWDEEQDNEAVELWFSILDKMIYAFEDASPEIDDYDFRIDMNKTEDYSEDNRRYTMEVVNQEEYDRYKNDLMLHEEKVREGLELFSKYYKDLWW